jgi:hypothetical protein
MREGVSGVEVENRGKMEEEKVGRRRENCKGGRRWGRGDITSITVIRNIRNIRNPVGRNQISNFSNKLSN